MEQNSLSIHANTTEHAKIRNAFNKHIGAHQTSLPNIIFIFDWLNIFSKMLIFALIAHKLLKQKKTNPLIYIILYKYYNY
jgi:hypothetical protein